MTGHINPRDRGDRALPKHTGDPHPEHADLVGLLDRLAEHDRRAAGPGFTGRLAAATAEVRSAERGAGARVSSAGVIARIGAPGVLRLAAAVAVVAAGIGATALVIGGRPGAGPQGGTPVAAGPEDLVRQLDAELAAWEAELDPAGEATSPLAEASRAIAFAASDLATPGGFVDAGDAWDDLAADLTEGSL